MPPTSSTVPPSPSISQEPFMPQAPAVPLVFAGFWLRAVASLIDGFILGIIMIVLNFTVSKPLATLSSIVISLLYYSLMESSARKASLGKMLVGIRVSGLDASSRISFGRALGRTVGKYVSALIIFIGYLMAAFTEKKQALHDMMAGTLVVREAKTHAGRGVLVLVLLAVVLFVGSTALGIGAALVALPHASSSDDVQPALEEEVSASASASQYDAALAAPVLGLDTVYSGPHTTSGPVFLSWDGIFLTVALPVVPGIDKHNTVFVNITHAYTISGKDINDASSTFNIDPFFQETSMKLGDNPAHYYGLRSTHLISDADDKNIARLTGTVTLELPATNNTKYTKVYPFDLTIKTKK